MKISEPNELLRLCFQYKVHQIPVQDDGRIRGCIHKEDLVRYLRKTEHFTSSIIETIDELSRPADESLLDTLREKLRGGEISGLPILGVDGNIQRVITPGILQSQDESEEFLTEVGQRAVFEQLLQEFPFPMELLVRGQVVFENEAARRYTDDKGSWPTLTYQQDETELKVFVPAPLHSFMEAYFDFQEGESIDLRHVMSDVEQQILQQARQSSESVSDAAKRVEMPRQTFHYRWKKKEQ